MSKLSETDQSNTTRVKGRRSFITLSFLTLLLATGVVACHMYAREIGESMPKFDKSMINLVTTLAVMVTAFAWWLWLIIKGPSRVWSRVIPAFLALALVAAFLLVEPVFDGNAGLIGLRWRFAKRAPELIVSDVFVDLTIRRGDGFPQFLGPNRDGVISDVKLERDWQTHRPKLVWRVPIGTGASGFAANNRFAVTLEQRDELEMVTCYQNSNGHVAWAYAIPNRHYTTLGKEGPRSTPTIHRGKVYAVTANGILLCLDGQSIGIEAPAEGATNQTDTNDNNQQNDSTETESALADGESEQEQLTDVEQNSASINKGKPEWQVNIPELLDLNVERNTPLVGLPNDQEQSNLNWGRAGSPLIYKNLVIVPGGGKSGGAHTSLLGFDIKTGDLKWKAGERPISYSSPNFAVLAGVPQIVIVNESTANGYDAETGEELWNHPRPGSSSGDANCSQVTIVSDNQVLLTKGYGLGGELVELTPTGDGKISAKSVWKIPQVLKTKFSNPVIKDGYAYALSEGILECVRIEDGERMWKDGRFGNGQLLLIGDDLIVTEERTGTIKLIEATPEEYREHGVYKNAIRGVCWNTLCFVNGNLIIRSDQEATCLQLATKKNDNTDQ